jgi:hypothetical protein
MGITNTCPEMSDFEGTLYRDILSVAPTSGAPVVGIFCTRVRMPSGHLRPWERPLPAAARGVTVHARARRPAAAALDGATLLIDLRAKTVLYPNSLFREDETCQASVGTFRPGRKPPGRRDRRITAFCRDRAERPGSDRGLHPLAQALRARPAARSGRGG